VCRRWTAKGEQSGLRTRIAATKSVSLAHAEEKLTAFLELESAIRDFRYRLREAVDGMLTV
jgi:hypothetical protein